MLRNAVLLFACISLLAGAVIGCGNAALSSPEELFVFAAGGTRPAIDEAVALFEQETGIKVAVNYGGAGEVLSAMVLAKTGDIYIAPEQRFMNSARKQGVIAADAPVDSLAYMVPVIGVEEGNPLHIQSLADLARPGTEIAMCNPETTSLGELAPEMLRASGLYETVMPNVIAHVPQVTSLVTMLKMGQVDVGIIWHHFGVTNADDLDVIWIPAEYVSAIGHVQAAVSNYCQDVKTARKFIDFLLSPQGKEIFEKNGYFTDIEEVNKLWRNDLLSKN